MSGKHCLKCQNDTSDQKSENFVCRSTNCTLNHESGAIFIMRDIVYQAKPESYQSKCLCDTEIENKPSSVHNRRKDKVGEHCDKSEEEVVEYKKDKGSGVKNKKEKNWRKGEHTGKLEEEEVVELNKNKDIDYNNKKGKSSRRDKPTAAIITYASLPKPQWFHQLSLQQMSLLHTLSASLRDDFDSGDVQRTMNILRKLTLHPMPQLSTIKYFMRSCGDNGVSFLAGLLMALPANGILHKGDIFSRNQQLIMSGVCFLEMPMLYQLLSQSLSFSHNDPSKRGGPSDYGQKMFELPAGEVVNLIKRALEPLTSCDLVCIKFPDLESHPQLIHLLLYRRWKWLTKSDKQSLLQVTRSTADQLKRLLTTHAPAKMKLRRKEMTTWQEVVNLKRKVGMRHKIFFDVLWNARYRTGQEFWSSLHPTIFNENKLLQMFYCYITCNYETVLPY